MRHTHARLLIAALSLLPLFACESAPRARPVKMGPVDTGADSMEAVRRRLQGTWELTSLDVFSPSGDKRAATATGRLQYDEFGNMSMQGVITGGPEVDSSVLNITGRVAIDPNLHTLRFQAIQGASADDKRVDPQLDASKVRYYEFDGELLKTTAKSASGATTATAVWKRVG